MVSCNIFIGGKMWCIRMCTLHSLSKAPTWRLKRFIDRRIAFLTNQGLRVSTTLRTEYRNSPSTWGLSWVFIDDRICFGWPSTPHSHAHDNEFRCNTLSQGLFSSRSSYYQDGWRTTTWSRIARTGIYAGEFFAYSTMKTIPMIEYTAADSISIALIET